MHRVASDALRLKRWLRMAIDRCELLPIDIYPHLGVDGPTFNRWMSLDDERFIHLGHLPTVLSLLDEKARQDLDELLNDPQKTRSA